MSNPNLSNPEKLVNEARLNEYHQTILPYLGGHIECGFTPVGAVIMMSGNEAPKHYLKCDGTVYNIADYPELAAFYARSQGSCNFYGGNGTTTFAVPDLRGEFVRGTGTNSHANGGNGAAVGTHQDPTEIPYSQFQNNNNGKGNIYCVVPTIPSGGTAANSNPANMDKKGSTTIYGDGIIATSAPVNTRDITGTGSSRYSARPTNTSVLFCVASKNIYLDARFDYSLEEKVVGEWIDGKPLYQKTFSQALVEYSTGQYAGVKAIADISLSGLINLVTNIECVVVDISNNSIMYPNSGNDGLFRTVLALISDNRLSVRSSSTNDIGKIAYATIQYTKTTDA